MVFSTVVKGKKWYLKRTFHEGRPFYYFESTPTHGVRMPQGFEFGGVATKPHLPFIKKKTRKVVRRKNVRRKR